MMLLLLLLLLMMMMMLTVRFGWVRGRWCRGWGYTCGRSATCAPGSQPPRSTRSGPSITAEGRAETGSLS
jgi:hypothetical protein